MAFLVGPTQPSATSDVSSEGSSSIPAIFISASQNLLAAANNSGAS